MELSWFTFTASGSFCNPRTYTASAREEAQRREKRETRNRRKRKRKGWGDLAEVGGGDAGEVEPARGAGAGEHGGRDEEERQRRAGRRRRHGWPGIGEDGKGRGKSSRERPSLGFDGCPRGGWPGFRWGGWQLARSPAQFGGACLASRTCRVVAHRNRGFRRGPGPGWGRGARRRCANHDADSRGARVC